MDTRLGTSAALNVPVIWVSRSIRSTTISTVGLLSPAIARSFSAVNTISSDLPDPWKCQIRPCLTRPSNTRSTIRLVAWNCWYRAMILILRCLLSVAKSVKNRRKSSTAEGRSRPSTASPTASRPLLARRVLFTPWSPQLDGHADGAVPQVFALGGKRQDVRHEEHRDVLLVVLIDLRRAVDPGIGRADRGLRLADHEREPVAPQHQVEAAFDASLRECHLCRDDPGRFLKCSGW